MKAFVPNIKLRYIALTYNSCNYGGVAMRPLPSSEDGPLIAFPLLNKAEYLLMNLLFVSPAEEVDSSFERHQLSISRICE